MTHILVGHTAINHFYNENWSDFQASILLNNEGDIIGWDSGDSVATLLDILSGWEEFIELSGGDLKDIELNTKIEIVY